MNLWQASFAQHGLAVALGGALGALARYWITLYTYEATHRFPLGTLAVNLMGSFLIGVVYVLVIKGGLPAVWKAIVMTGFLGAFTTFSTFSLDALILWQNGYTNLALFYVLASVFGGFLAVLAAVSMMTRFI